jgi:hypothetical protein
MGKQSRERDPATGSTLQLSGSPGSGDERTERIGSRKRNGTPDTPPGERPRRRLRARSTEGPTENPSRAARWNTPSRALIAPRGRQYSGPSADVTGEESALRRGGAKRGGTAGLRRSVGTSRSSPSRRITRAER